LFAAISGGATILGIGGGTGAGLAAISAAATSGSAIKSLNMSLPENSIMPLVEHRFP
jgi:hypothetical protein